MILLNEISFAIWNLPFPTFRNSILFDWLLRKLYIFLRTPKTHTYTYNYKAMCIYGLYNVIFILTLFLYFWWNLSRINKTKEQKFEKNNLLFLRFQEKNYSFSIHSRRIDTYVYVCVTARDVLNRHCDLLAPPFRLDVSMLWKSILLISLISSRRTSSINLFRRACIRRGGDCYHRRKDCCYSSSCRCNLWGSNCQCQRMGLFQKWG